MAKGRDTNKPSGNQTVPVWNRIKLKQTDFRVSPILQTKQNTLKQSETHLNTLNQTNPHPYFGQYSRCANFQPIPTDSPAGCLSYV